MIKKTHLLAFVTVVMLLSSCAKRIAVPYSTVEKIVKVTPGMTTSDVSSTLVMGKFKRHGGQTSESKKYYIIVF